MRLEVPTNSPYADLIRFSRAVRVGNHVSVAGTAPMDAEGATVGIDDPAAQARRCYRIIEEALAEAGASLSDVVRTRTMLTHVEDWEAVGKVRGEVFKGVRPVDTVVEVSRFIHPEWRVEIEVEAIVSA